MSIFFRYYFFPVPLLNIHRMNVINIFIFSYSFHISIYTLMHWNFIFTKSFSFPPESNGTDLTEALRYFTNVIKKRCTAFLLSDFYDENYSDALKIAANKHDLVAVRITDEKEQRLPNLGLVKFYDPESGQTIWVDTSSKQTRDEFANAYEQHRKRTDETLKKYGIDQTELYTGEDFVKPLMKLFKMR